MNARAADIMQVQAQSCGVEALHDRGMTWVSFKPMPDVACGIDFALRKFPDLGLLSGTAQGVRHEHARRNSGDGDDDFSFHLNVKGVSLVASQRGETTLHDGDAMLLRYSVARTISRPHSVDHRVIRLPRTALSPLVRNIDDAVLCRIPQGTGMLRLLQGYVDTVFADPALSDAQMRRIISAQLCDLVAATLGATRDALALAEGRGIRAARLRAIKADIEAHLAAGDLSPGAIAKRQHISDSYIRKLFESEGTSLSQFVLARRLERAHHMLTDRRWAGHSIASIAFAVGFGDLSYFNRTFKRCYGRTPTEMRTTIGAAGIS
jgi:AraC-like DNA-binding protein